MALGGKGCPARWYLL